jgi:hypothetical protein
MVISSSPHHDDVSADISTTNRAVQGKAEVAFEKYYKPVDKVTLVHLDDAVVDVRLDGCVSEEDLGVGISLSGWAVICTTDGKLNRTWFFSFCGIKSTTKSDFAGL